MDNDNERIAFLEYQLEKARKDEKNAIERYRDMYELWKKTDKRVGELTEIQSRRVNKINELVSMVDYLTESLHNYDKDTLPIEWRELAHNYAKEKNKG